ncbi:MAG: DUF2760 domain-containing protein [Deltaproteobacteria bacterium]|nr:DUF2760 domain-containing protein [Deltaproteobacteria bacterium]
MTEPSFAQRLAMAFTCFFQLLLNAAFARAVLPAFQALREGRPLPLPAEPPAAAAPTPVPAVATAPARVTPEQAHAPALALLAMLQREGRLVDFLQEDLTGAPDADVGGAARVVHEGCRRVLRQYLVLERARPESEGDRVTLPAGFDAQRVRLTGNVTGAPPFNGTLRHPGWLAAEVKLPPVAEGMDARVLQAAEVEL